MNDLVYALHRFDSDGPAWF